MKLLSGKDINIPQDVNKKPVKTPLTLTILFLKSESIVTLTISKILTK